MENINIHIGLDFGTKQTKICTFNTKTKEREIFEFDENQFFLPSIVSRSKENKFEYGKASNKNQYRYFKMAAAEDEEFVNLLNRYTQNNHLSEATYINPELDFTPELLCTVYLTYILFTVKEKFEVKEMNQNNFTGLLRRIFKDQNPKNKYTFSVQMGIPTEWSQTKYLMRKRKFENILIFAHKLQESYKDKSDFLNQTTDDIQEKLVNIFHETKLDGNTLDATLNECALSVFPESAAGLSFLVKNKQLGDGYFAAADIGGGSTDVSFFKIDNDKVYYIASESFMVASNSIYYYLKDEKDNLIGNIEDIESNLHNVLKDDSKLQKEENEIFADTIKEINKILQRLMQQLFAKRVRWYHENKGILNKFRNQKIILFGGGSNFPFLNSGVFEVWSNGGHPPIGSFSNAEQQVYLEKSIISEYINQIDLKPSIDKYSNVLNLLAVCIGLSYFNEKSTATWFNEEMYNINDYQREPEAVKLENNFRYYSYDIVRREWS